MWTLIRHELMNNRKSFGIWSICVSGMCLFCILLFDSMEESMAGMAENFAQMGAFADAFGMNRLSIATLQGFYAAEVGTIHSLGGAMFAAMLGAVMLSKEEDGHTGEFLYTLPISRVKAVLAKYIAMLVLILLFNVICILVYQMGFGLLGEGLEQEKFICYHSLQTILHTEIGSLCFLLSSSTKRNKMGMGLGIALVLYVYDLIARVVPALEDYQLLSPFAYANAADIFSTGEVSGPGLALGVAATALALLGAILIYNKRDLAA